MNDSAIKLHSLTPKFEEASHGLYLKLLEDAFEEDDIRNIALSGQYGIGKSSVLREFQSRRNKKTSDTITVSMSRLSVQPSPEAVGESDEQRQASTNPAPSPEAVGESPTNMIQKEIVKQLLYRESAQSMRGSRFRRIEAFSPLTACLHALVIGLCVALVAFLFGLPRMALQATGIGSPPWWTILLVVIVVPWAAAFAFLKATHNRLHIGEASIGSATVKLSEGSKSFFDEYLDEIVFFFSQTDVRTVVFEDLDRFDHPHIFETLRSLNNQLNNTRERQDAPIRFIYAIRDSIFEEGKTITHHQLATRPATDRTKFFDLIIPVVPFVSPTATDDLIKAEFDGMPEQWQPSPATRELVASFLTDMRLIKNIRNEFAVFAHRLLRSDLPWLNTDRLFAMVVYKNLYMSDFDAISQGSSALNRLYAVFRALANHQIGSAQRDIEAAQSQLDKFNEAVPRSQELGERLLAVLRPLNAVLVQRNPPQPDTILVHASSGPNSWSGAKQIAADSVHAPEFWAGVVDKKTAISVGGNPLDITALNVLMERDLFGGWQEKSKALLEQRLRRGRAAVTFIRNASIHQLLERTDLTVLTTTAPEGDDDKESLSDAARRILGAGPAYELLQAGLIDENFALYATQCGVFTNPRTMNFILHNVQPDVPDPYYRFNSENDDPAVIGQEVDQIAHSQGARFLRGRSVYNLEVFNHYLARAADDDDPLEDAIHRLAVGDDTEFLETYVQDGSFPDTLVSRLAPQCPKIIQFLVGRQVPAAQRLSLLDVGLSNVSADTKYVIGDDERSSIATHYPDLKRFTEPIDKDSAQALAELISRWGVAFDDLSTIAEPQRSAIVETGRYPITGENLKAAAPSAASLALDDLKAANPTVYKRVLDGLDAYLNDPVCQESPSVQAADAFPLILRDVVDSAPNHLEAVARAASKDCLVGSLSDTDESLWGVLARTKRFPPTFANILMYVTPTPTKLADEMSHTVNDLAVLLEGVMMLQAVTRSADDGKIAVAQSLLKTDALPASQRVSLIDSLDLESWLDTSTVEDPNLIPMLVENAVIEDGPKAYQRVSDAPLEVKKDLLIRSRRPEHMSALNLRAEDLSVLLDDNMLCSRIAAVIANDWSTWLNTLNDKSATYLANWLIRNPSQASATAFTTLATAKASQRVMINLLATRCPDWALGDIVSALKSLASPYPELADVAVDGVELPDSPDNRVILDRLQELGLIAHRKVRGQDMRRAQPPER